MLSRIMPYTCTFIFPSHSGARRRFNVFYNAHRHPIPPLVRQPRHGPHKTRKRVPDENPRPVQNPSANTFRRLGPLGGGGTPWGCFAFFGALSESGVFLGLALPVVSSLGGFLLGFVVVAPAAECLEVVGVVGAASGEVVFVVDLECFCGVVLPSAVLAGVVVAGEGGFALLGGYMFLFGCVLPAHSVVMAVGLLCHAIISPWWAVMAV